ncbi:MAG: hypothetical protein AB4352_21155 [Hormoscilla sp.]
MSKKNKLLQYANWNGRDLLHYALMRSISSSQERDKVYCPHCEKGTMVSTKYGWGCDHCDYKEWDNAILIKNDEEFNKS